MRSANASAVRNFARWLRSLLRGSGSVDRLFRPGFSGDDVVNRLARYGGSSPAGGELRRDSEAGLAATEQVAVYFREYDGVRFFAESHGLISAAERIAAERPQWREATMRRATAANKDGLPIYNGKSPPLRPGYPWGGLPPGPGNDKLYRKRPHRFAFAPGICLAALYGESVPGDFPELLSEWMTLAASDDNDIAYNSNLAVIQRVLALSWAWAFLSARPPDRSPTGLALEGTILTILDADVQFLASRLGRSYANNHLLADGFGGWFIGSVWPEFAGREGWGDTYEELFLGELRRQVLPDGSSFEHSIHYHEMACEMAAAYVILNRRKSRRIADWIEDRTRRMLRLQTDLGGPQAVTLRLGDATEEAMFPLDNGDGWGTAAWRELYRAMFDPGCPSAPAHAAAVERAFWLLGGQLAGDAGRSVPESASASLFSYVDGGFHIFADGSKNAQLTFRTAPGSGQPVCAGHMHADLMGVYLSIGEHACIVDAGTYTYRSKVDQWHQGAPAWRRYFTGPAAHNSLCIGRDDPLGPATRDFRPAENQAFVTTDARVGERSCAWVEARLAGAGSYDGYRRGVVHVPGEYWLVYDILPEGSIEQPCHIGFQLAPEATVMTLGRTAAEISIADVEFRVDVSSGFQAAESVCGRTDPLGGWVSERYGELSEAPQLRFPVMAGTRHVAAIIQAGAVRARAPQIEFEHRTGDCLALRVSCGSNEDIVLMRRPGVRTAVRHGGIEFDGELLWLRSRAGQAAELRWLNGRSTAVDDQSIRIHSRAVVPSLSISVVDGTAVVEERPDTPLELVWPGRTQ